MRSSGGQGAQNFVARGGSPSGQVFVRPGGGGQNFAVRGGGQNFVAQGGGNWNHWRGRPHVRGPGIVYGFAAPYGYATPYYYDEATPNYYSEDDGCYQLRAEETSYGIAYRRVWVCD